MTTSKNDGMSKFMVLRLLEKFICKPKIESGHFYSWPPGKILPKVLITLRQREITHFPQRGFFRVQQKGSVEKLCCGTRCFCISALLNIISRYLYFCVFVWNPRISNCDVIIKIIA